MTFNRNITRATFLPKGWEDVQDFSSPIIQTLKIWNKFAVLEGKKTLLTDSWLEDSKSKIQEEHYMISPTISMFHLIENAWLPRLVLWLTCSSIYPPLCLRTCFLFDFGYLTSYFFA